MKTINLIVLALVAIYLLAAPLALGQGGQTGKVTGESVAEQVKALHEQSRQAALKGDTSWQEKYLADDFIGISGDGRIATKVESIQMRKSGAIKVESVDEREVKTRVYGDTAIVNTLALVRLTVDGKPVVGDHRATFVFVKLKGGWKEVSFQVTPVAPASK
jgi:hypothetical protein